jgi:hypothetical protein
MTMPDEEQYRKLIAAWRDQTKKLDKTEDHKARLDIVINALRNTVLYFGLDPEVRKERLTRLLGLAENALLDARQGANPPLLDHPPDGRKPQGTTHEYVQGCLAWVLELLVSPKGGHMGTDRATRWIVEEARRTGLTDSTGSAITAAQVKRWREDISRGRAPAAAREMWEANRRYAPDVAVFDMPSSDLKRERAMQRARSWIWTVANTAPMSAPKAPHTL